MRQDAGSAINQPGSDLLSGTSRAFYRSCEKPNYAELSFEERLGLLVDIETTRRANNSLRRRVRAAWVPLLATMEDLDHSAKRGLKRGQVLQLTQSEWASHHLNLLILDATGVGKTYLACALGWAAGKVRYERTSRLLQSLELAHADGSFPQLLHSLAGIHLLIFDDWLRDPLSRSQAIDLLEILDDRYGRCATMVVTQVPTADWHSRIPDPMISDAVLDCLIHNAYRLEFEGGSMRKAHSLLHEYHR